MTRRSSQRAHAREVYREMVAERNRQTGTPTPDPSPHTKVPAPPKAAAGGGGVKENLTEKARALYEHSAVPVAEIAAAVGVTERTIYKYAQKGGWQPRYAWIDRGGVNRRRGWRAGQDFAPAKGAAGRFIRRADKGKPFATGLKAADPQGAARGRAACAEAEAAARAAQAEAAIEACNRTLAEAWKKTHRAIDELNAYYKDYARRHGRMPPADDELEQLHAESIRDHFVWLRDIWAELMELHAEARRCRAASYPSP